MADTTTEIRISTELALETAAAFNLVLEELTAAFERGGMQFEARADGQVIQSGFQVARVLGWKPGESLLLEWHPADWDPEYKTEVELRFEPSDGGTRVTLEHRGWGQSLGGPPELAGWFAHQIAAPSLQATAPAAFADWITDRRARRPSGAQARSVYQDPLFHYPNFRVILQELALTKNDYLVEVGCGGGAMLKDALRSGCRAAAVDHSPEMVRLAREANHDAIADGRLEILEAKADHLPFADATFTCAAMTGVLGFLPDPVAAFAEIRRVLRPGGRFVGLGSDVEMKGTPAAPEPIASRLHFYSEQELQGLALQAGFDEAQVVRRNLYDFARDVGVPEQALWLFKGPGPSFLLARRH